MTPSVFDRTCHDRCISHVIRNFRYIPKRSVSPSEDIRYRAVASYLVQFTFVCWFKLHIVPVFRKENSHDVGSDDMVMLFVAAPAAGGHGGGSRQAGHHDRAECDHRGKYHTGSRLQSHCI
jgi:hypothetical protein